MMKLKPVPWPLLLLSGALVLAMAAFSPAVNKSVPTPVDLIQYGGGANSVVVQLVNLTPYEIVYDSSAMTNQMDQNRKTKKHFMFAPVGIPKQIAGLPPEADPDSTQYNPNYENKVTHPYCMVFSWDDRAGQVENNSVFWKAKGVKYFNPRTNDWVTEDVGVGLWLTRQKPNANIKATCFYQVKEVVETSLKIVGVIMDPANPIAWVKAVLALGEFAKGEANFIVENSNPDNGEKMYISAMAVPVSPGSCAGGIGQGCCPSYSNMSSDPNGFPDDAVNTQWAPSNGGDAPSQLVVVTQLLRGSYPQPRDGIGRIPIVVMTVCTMTTYSTSNLAAMPASSMQVCPGGAKIHSILQQRGRAGLHQLHRLIRSLNQNQAGVFQETCRSLRAKHPLTMEQKMFLELMAVALEKNRTTLNPADLPRGENIHEQ